MNTRKWIAIAGMMACTGAALAGSAATGTNAPAAAASAPTTVTGKVDNVAAPAAETPKVDAAPAVEATVIGRVHVGTNATGRMHISVVEGQGTLHAVVVNAEARKLAELKGKKVVVKGTVTVDKRGKKWLAVRECTPAEAAAPAEAVKPTAK
jgi:hypothetical protein